MIGYICCKCFQNNDKKEEHKKNDVTVEMMPPRPLNILPSND